MSFARRFPAERYAVLKAARPDLADALFEAVETGANEVAIVSLDGRPVHLLAPWQMRVYWKVATSIDVERIDTASDARVSARHLAMIERNRPTIVTEAVVENHEAGLLYVEGRLVGAARAGPARLLGGGPQDRGQAARSASAGGRDHRAGDADQGSHRAAGDPDRVPPDRRSGARGCDRAGRGRVAVPAGAVRDP